MAAISAKTDQPEVAKKFIEFLLQPETQQQLVDAGDEGYFEPSVAGVNEKEDREKDGKLVYAEASWASEHEAEIKECLQMSPRNSGKLRSAAHRGQAEGAIGWIVLSVLAVLIILPLGSVLLQIVSPGFFGNTEKADGMSLLFEVFEKSLWYKALGNSKSLGIWTTFFGTAFGRFLQISA